MSRAGGGGEERSIAGAGGGEEGGVDRTGASASEENGGCGLELSSGAETTLAGDEARVVSPSSLTVRGNSTRRRLVGGSSSRTGRFRREYVLGAFLKSVNRKSIRTHE